MNDMSKTSEHRTSHQVPTAIASGVAPLVIAVSRVEFGIIDLHADIDKLSAWIDSSQGSPRGRCLCACESGLAVRHSQRSMGGRLRPHGTTAHDSADAARMIPVAFALGAAVSWAVSAVFARQGLRYMPATIGTFLSLISGVVLMVGVVALFQRDQLADLTWAAVGIFAAVGLFNFVLGRYLNFLSIGHLGVARATPITASTPLFAAILAVLLLGETLNALTVLGTGLVLAGIYVVLKEP